VHSDWGEGKDNGGGGGGSDIISPPGNWVGIGGGRAEAQREGHGRDASARTVRNQNAARRNQRDASVRR